MHRVICAIHAPTQPPGAVLARQHHQQQLRKRQLLLDPINRQISQSLQPAPAHYRMLPPLFCPVNHSLQSVPYHHLKSPLLFHQPGQCSLHSAPIRCRLLPNHCRQQLSLLCGIFWICRTHQPSSLLYQRQHHRRQLRKISVILRTKLPEVSHCSSCLS